METTTGDVRVTESLDSLKPEVIWGVAKDYNEEAARSVI